MIIELDSRLTVSSSPIRAARHTHIELRKGHVRCMATARRGLATERHVNAVQQSAHMIDTIKAFDVCEISIPDTGR